ncbi:MAG: cAMP-activated global transcriptional regulator CRP [Gammaproteobacteria bacterium]|nr:cAMP-activated global transcriptional regulator CRP [Gammaproteobacteria bacterium]
MADNGRHRLNSVIERFLSYSHIRSFPAKHVLIREGDPSQDLYYIVRGSATVAIEDQHGREIVLAYLNAGDFFGEIGLFDEEHKRTAFVRARTACDVATIGYEKFKSLHELFPELLFQIASQMAIRLRRTSRKVSDLAFTDVKGRVARALLDLSREPDAVTHPQGMLVHITRQELGRIVGCSREMVGRVLKDLEEDRLIALAGRSIVVLRAR